MRNRVFNLGVDVNADAVRVAGESAVAADARNRVAPLEAAFFLYVKKVTATFCLQTPACAKKVAVTFFIRSLRIKCDPYQAA